MNKKSASDILREKYMASHLKKTVTEKSHMKLDDMPGISDIRGDITSKIYFPLFQREKYIELGANPPKSLLIHGISGVGKSFLLKCFCQQYQIPLLTNFINSSKDIKDLFSRSKTVEKSIIFIKNIDRLAEEAEIIHVLNESIKDMDWNSLVVITNKNIPDFISFDNDIFIKIPTIHGRKEILDSLLSELKSEGVETHILAQNTPGFVPAALVKLISMALTKSIERIHCYNDASNALININLNKRSNIISGLSYGENKNIIMEDFLNAIQDWKNIELPITFEDIGALEKVKQELTMSILLPSRYPAKFHHFGISKPSGILLYGPPGCGKTLIAKAVSNMSHCNFLSIKGPELITKYVGDSEKHLRDLFMKAKNLSPCVLFFDEIDSLCSKRGKNEFGNRIVNQILTLLDGMEDRGEVYLIGATNRIDSIDSALLRPGRFDKVIEVPLPTQQEGLEIFKKCISKVPTAPFDFVGLELDGLSGADISGIVKEAAIMCLKDNFETENLTINKSYFEIALEKYRSMKIISKKKNK